MGLFLSQSARKLKEYAADRPCMSFRTIITLLFLSMIVVACSGNGGTGNVVREPTVEPSTPPTPPAQETLPPTTQPDVPAAQGCGTPLTPAQLEAALPASAGFTAGTPDANTLTWTNPSTGASTTYSGASVALTKNDRALFVSLVDSCDVPALRDPWTAAVMQETDSGYLKRTMINGYDAWEQYDKASSTYSITVVAGNRLIANVQGAPDVPLADVQTVAKDIKLSAVL